MHLLQTPAALFLFLLLLLLATCTPTSRGWPFLGPVEGEGSSEETRARALQKLLEVFGLEGGPPQLPPQQQAKRPPQYMLDLYRSVAGEDGVTKNPDLLVGNTVRSFFEKAHSERRFLFALSSVAKNEKILTAELHLFKLWAKVGQDGPVLRRQHFCQVSVYQVLDTDRLDSPGGKKLLSARLLTTHVHGWEVFTITQAVREWTAEESRNQGLLVTVQGLGGTPTDEPPVQFASGRDHHESKKPILVLFTDDGRRAAALPTNPFVGGPGASAAPALLPAPFAGPKSNRMRASRSAGGSSPSSSASEGPQPPRPCQRYPLSVDFEEIGWSGWIISPRTYNAYHCRGACPFPLGENMRPTNHATVLSIINALKLSREVAEPCCVPNRLFSINLLYFDDHENVVLKQYDDMVAGSCGCH
ncbi:hypothetical protein JRQ81_008696 [Phrynocephalus forsythii]|uniref:TGF-beta family profile domain-containing protein n=1 Tax=Phrynocephalus forsythii TaxID=171643 RepID=A0A9Q1ASW4_9SAUR|nr:hypothetical protein JRQ81_008696 [Phrynocephalus forsythii]